MGEVAHSPLVAWESFYVIVGSSGAALTGLQFVVIALIAESKRRATIREIDAFGTPTIIHFCAVLLVSAIMSAPWGRLGSAGIALGTCGIVGMVYGVVVMRRTGRQKTYRPVFEDWLFHVVLPIAAYALLLIAAIGLPRSPRRVLFLVAGSALLLLFIGIHNAWDTVTYIAVGLVKDSDIGDSQDEPNPEPESQD